MTSPLARRVLFAIAFTLLAGCDAASRQPGADQARNQPADVLASDQPGGDTRDTSRPLPLPTAATHNEDSARTAFAAAVTELLLDTRIHEIRGHLSVKVRNPNRDDESPLAEQDVSQGASPGPHTYLGVLHADLRALRRLFGERVPMSVEGERVFLGTPAVAIDGHLHGDALFVPVKAFARPYGAYVRIGCTLANCGTIWTGDILSYMRSIGFAGAPGVLEAHAEGLVDTLDVRAIRFGW